MNTQTRILLVDDDPDILRILKDNLELDGYEVYTAKTGKAALEAFETLDISVLILDLSLPDIDGIQICRLIRRQSSAPIIMLTARDRIPDKVLGLESGADDYMSKPFDYLELNARIKACLRRHTPRDRNKIINLGDLRIEPGKKAVYKRGIPVGLTFREFNLLVFLAGNSDTVVERSAIRKALWPGGDIYRESRVIDVHVQHLRGKLEDNPTEPKYILTIPGVGYMLTTTQTTS
jgi:DNA-binding response OmpR family regulator